MKDILKEIGLPFAYHHFAEGKSPKPPFLIYYYPRSENFSADGLAYYKIQVIHLELYTDNKNFIEEERIETVLDRHGIFYDKLETYIESEKLYEVLYIFKGEEKYGK